MVNMTIPGLTELSDINMLFLCLQKSDPDVFFDGVRVISVYGGVPGAKFCGGRNSFGACMDLGQVSELVARYNDLGAACNLTYTNQLVDERALAQSGYSTALLDVLDQGAMAGVRNGVVLYADALDEYVAREHPSLTRISSTTKDIEDVAAINEEAVRFDRVVLNYNLTRSKGVISQIAHPEKLEVMVNEYCTPGCPNRRRHYQHISLDQVRGSRTPFVCAFAEARPPQALGFLNGLINGSVFLRNEDVRAYADELGVGSFKVVGRELARYDVVDSYLYYLIKPEYWYEVRDMLIQEGCL